jgi:hypothetical protein
MAFGRSAFRRALLAIFICAALVAGTAHCEEPPLPDQPKDYAAIVRPQLPPGWHCSYDFSTLVIAHDEQVTYLNKIGLPGGKRNDAFFKEYGVGAPYLIVMKFVSRLSEADQRALVDRRNQAVDDARKGREHEKYTGADVYEQHFVPKYFNDRFSIDVQMSDSWPLELVSPADVVKQRDAILKLLQANLRKYPVRR